jgi:hypothetical protein
MKNQNLFPIEKSASTCPPASPKRAPVVVRPSRDEVARTAYAIYLEQGCPQGCDVEHWLTAEARMLEAHHARGTSLSM